MKFTDYKYERPDIDKFEKDVVKLLNKIGEDNDSKSEIKAIEEYFLLLDKIESMATLVSIRNSLNTKDEFYQKEQAFFDENSPRLQGITNRFSKKLLQSKNRENLEAAFGKLLFTQVELQEKTFSEAIIPDLQKENKLSTKYSKLLAGAEIEFQGKIYNLTQMSPFLQSLDRNTRHQAQLKVSEFFEKNEEEIDRIYDEMVNVRDKIAKQLGYENFIQLGYDRLGRTDYNEDDVKNYRDQILQDVVPFAKDLIARQSKRIGIDDPKSYDLTLSFKTGNPTPKGNMKWQVGIAKKMYEEMSEKTGEFFNYMLDHELLELDSKPGKAGGGYCTYIPEYNSPFIFANFNGTAHDVNVLTHEAGHAFQIYSSRDKIPAYRWPTMEAAEIHSMSMEFLAWPWIHEFFKEDAEKSKFNHLNSSVLFLPYGVLVDEFQHEVYRHPTMTPDERKATWRRLEKKYLPYKDYDDDAFLDKGTYWYRQGHIFGSPFYYIDYTLAQVLAFQFFVLSRENHKQALEKYIHLCSLGGSKSFVNLVESAGLNNPFKKGTIASVMKPIKAYLDSVNDTKL